MSVKVQRIILIAALSMAASCTALLGLGDKTFDGAGGAGGASSSLTSSSTSSSASSSSGMGGASSSGTSGSSSSGPDAGTVKVLYSGAKVPVSLALDGTTLFWSTSNDFMSPDGEVMRIETDGSNVQSLATSQTNPISLAFDDKNLYWVTTVNTQSSINKVAKVGGPVSTLAGVPMDTFLGLSVLSPTAYFTTSTMGNVIGMLTAGGGISLLVPNQVGAGSIVADGAGLYWVDLGNFGMSNGMIMKAALNGMNPQMLAGGQEHPLVLKVDAAKVYWATVDGGLRSVNKDGTGLFTNIAPVGAPQNDLAVDATDIYYTTQHEVRKIPIGGTSSTLIYTTADTPQRLVVDSQYIYFTTSDNASLGAVLKIPKP